MKLINDNGEEVGPGERGEIHVRGPNVCLGYWQNEEATKKSFDSEGFLKTGDIAMRDEKGWYWIVDRKKELIKVRGFQVAPAELEAVLLENEHVADAAVCGVQSEYEELPRAYVVLKDDSEGKVSEQDIVAWLAERVARHKRLEGGLKVCLQSTPYLRLPVDELQFIDEVPKSSSGKIQRVIMREWAKRDADELIGGSPKAKL